MPTRFDDEIIFLEDWLVQPKNDKDDHKHTVSTTTENEEFYEELRAILNAAKEAKEIKIDRFSKAIEIDSHVGVVGEKGNITNGNFEVKIVE